MINLGFAIGKRYLRARGLNQAVSDEDSMKHREGKERRRMSNRTKEGKVEQSTSLIGLLTHA